MQSTGSRRLRGAVLVLAATVAVLLWATTAGLGATHTTQLGPAAQQTPSNNTTVQHERPSEAAGSGDTQAVNRWLERRLAGRLQGSVVNISQGQYDQARSVLGDDYSSRLGQYVDVAGETENDDDQAADTYESARRTQRAYANATQEYRETYDRYEQARREGNTTAARETARELETISQRVDRLNSSLQERYTELGNQTGIDTGPTRTVLTNATTNISTQQALVRSQTFVETNLTVRTNESAVAFDDPATITGRVRLANGTAVSDATGRVVVADRSYRIRTDSDGRFSVTYRPVSLPVNATSVRVQFLPANSSAYLGDDATVPVSVTQVSPRIEVTNVRATGGYGDALTTTVVATVDGRPVPSLPIRTRLGSTVVSGRTDGSGRVTLSPRVPATLPAGERQLRAAHGRSARAVGPNATAAPVTITETATELTVDTTSKRPLRVRGRLRTADGSAVSGQPIQLTIGDTDRSVETNATGWYRLSLSNASSIGGGDTLSVTARFDGGGTNLRDSRARTSVAFGSTGGGSTGGESVLTTPLVLAGLVLGVLLVAGVVGWSRRQGGRESTDVSTETSETVTTTATPDRSRQWLDHARDALATGDSERAVVGAYGAVRRELERDASLAPTLTHREFVAASETELAGADSGAFSTVATAYERATFAGGIDSPAAEAAVDAAAALLPDADEPAD